MGKRFKLHQLSPRLAAPECCPYCKVVGLVEIDGEAPVEAHIAACRRAAIERSRVRITVVVGWGDG